MVSIIMPVYKAEKYLKECLDSVLAQTYRDFEVILVDDGSPDRSGEICREYCRRDPRFRVIHQENAGPSAARNRGMELAAGEYLYFLDSDDRIAPELLQTLVPVMDQGADLAAFNYEAFYEDGRRETERRLSDQQIELTDQQARLDFLCNTLIPCKIGWEPWSRMFRRDLTETYGVRFESRVRIAEDLYFSLCYCAHARQIRCLSQCLYDYRKRQDSIMGVESTRSNLGKISTVADSALRFYRRFDDCSLLCEQFSRIYYQLIAGQFTYQLWASGLPLRQFRELVRQEVSDWDFMEDQLRQYLSCRDSRKNLQQLELRANVIFLLGGSERMLRLRCKALRILNQIHKAE